MFKNSHHIRMVFGAYGRGGIMLPGHRVVVGDAAQHMHVDRPISHGGEFQSCESRPPLTRVPAAAWESREKFFFLPCYAGISSMGLNWSSVGSAQQNHGSVKRGRAIALALGENSGVPWLGLNGAA